MDTPANAARVPQKEKGLLSNSKPGAVKRGSLLLAKHADGPFPASPVHLFSTHDVRGESPDLLADLYQRSRQVQQVCQQRRQKNQAPGQVMGIFTHDPSRVAYCFLPKAGCTFWIRVFSYLNNFTGRAVSSPWDIPRMLVHNTPHSHGVPWSKVQAKAKDYLRFMFVRHPFSRLWSAYLDKLFLPDFWSEVGVPVVRRLRGPKATMQARRCGHDVTFPEFVEASLGMREPHWEPIHQRCDPCQFQPAVIGSMHNFTSHSLFLLRRMGLEDVLKGLDPHDQEELELATLIDYNFQRIRSLPFYWGCIDDSQLAHRLWSTFQMNGYISTRSHFQPPASAHAIQNQLKAQAVSTFRASLPFRMKLKQQKREFLRSALASLPPLLVAKVKAKYKADMELFGFDDDNY